MFVRRRKFKHLKQTDEMDCGAVCLTMVCQYYDIKITLKKIRELVNTTRHGANLLDLSNAAEKIGFDAIGLKVNLKELEKITLPCILHWRQNHFVVLINIKKNRYFIADPAFENIQCLSFENFLKNWITDYPNSDQGIILHLIQKSNFKFIEDPKDSNVKKVGWKNLISQYLRYKTFLLQLIIVLFIGTVIQFIIPLLTQSIVDTGIKTHNINFIYLILIAQLVLFMSQSIIGFIRSWILLYTSSIVNLNFLSKFLEKIIGLPINYFENKTTGDIIQRMNDQQRIEAFLTGSFISTSFSIINLLIFSFLLFFYHNVIFFVFLFSTGIYLCWIILFLKKRRELDDLRFTISSNNQSQIIELFESIPEVKLNNLENYMLNIWKKIQTKLFQFKFKNLLINQYQQSGAIFINQTKNVLITFLCAQAVVEDELTLGGMVAIQYILGMVNSPVEQILSFIQSFQDAKMSLDRVNEVYSEESEMNEEVQYINEIPIRQSLEFQNVSFKYPGEGNDYVLKNINLTIPYGKTIAIVGMSGSGKTTLLKLILRYFKPQEGKITLGNIPIDQFSFSSWRKQCGVVMQNGYIFSDTLEKNISIGEPKINQEKLNKALKISNLEEFVHQQPYGLKTKIGKTGKGISQGQKQRILIARLIYNDPSLVLMDEATNALDANNEGIIVAGLKSFLNNKTAIIVAHRLTTVKNADKIIVLNSGEIVEQGKHEELISKRGYYYNLIKNQLELG